MIRFKFLSFGRKLDEMEFEFESSSTNFVKLREQADEQKQIKQTKEGGKFEKENMYPNRRIGYM